MLWALLVGAFGAEITLDVKTVDATVTSTTTSRLSQRLSRVQDFYAHGLGVRYPGTLEIGVTIIGKQDAYRAHAKAAGLPSWANGYFKAGPDIAPHAVLWAQEDREAMIRVFLHEGSHFLFQYAGRTPRWLNEGLAQCFEHSRISGNLLTIQPPPFYVDYLARTDAPDVEALILNKARWNDLPSDQVGPLYIQGWALTAFLMSSSQGQETLKAIVKAYKVEGTRSSGVKAIEDTYRGGMAGLQRDLAQWLTNPPSSVAVPRYVEIKESTDALWRTCPDGSLVSKSKPCP